MKGVPGTRLERIAARVSYRTMSFQVDWWRRRLDLLVGDAPPELSAAPEIGGRIMCHAEIADPPSLLGVGWRTGR